MNSFKYKFLAVLAMVLSLSLTSCQDEGYEDVSGTASQTLWEVISQRSDLSAFAQVLKQNGYDELLSSSGTFTVLAPGNSQMSAVESDKLNEVPGAHIARLGYNKLSLDKMEYLTMINDRQALLSELSLTDEEIVCRNGYLRFAKGAARATQLNLYEQLKALSEEYKMAAFITSLGDSIMDEEASVNKGVDENNQLIYDTVMTYFNPLFANVPYNDNDSLISVLLVDDETWDALIAKYSRYMRQHIDRAYSDPSLFNERYDERDPKSDQSYGFNTKLGIPNKVDSAATAQAAATELVYDLSFSYKGASRMASKNNPDAVREVYLSRSGVEVTMDNAVVSDTILTSNGRIEVASGVKVKMANNKIKDVYVEAEDYYLTNETYVATMVDPRFSGSRYVKTYGIDSLRMYDRYVLGEDGTRLKGANGKDSVQHVAAQMAYVYNTSQYANAFGGSVLGYKVKLYSCNYKVQWRHVVPGNQGTNYCNPDTLDVNYAKYAENQNWPIGGVMRHIQKLYFSQPGDHPLEYNSDLSRQDFVLNPYPYNSFNYSTYSYYRCMTDYDPEAVISGNAKTDEVGAFSPTKWFRMGVNAGYGVDDPTYETPLVWCNTSRDHADGQKDEFGNILASSYASGITAVSTVTNWVPVAASKGASRPTRQPNNILMCLYNGEATVFVTSSPFGTDNARGAANLNYCKGSIFLDYIHFIPVIEEDD